MDSLQVKFDIRQLWLFSLSCLSKITQKYIPSGQAQLRKLCALWLNALQKHIPTDIFQVQFKTTCSSAAVIFHWVIAVNLLKNVFRQTNIVKEHQIKLIFYRNKQIGTLSGTVQRQVWICPNHKTEELKIQALNFFFLLLNGYLFFNRDDPHVAQQPTV